MQTHELTSHQWRHRKSTRTESYNKDRSPKLKIITVIEWEARMKGCETLEVLDRK
jgi:hypothetical protein